MGRSNVRKRFKKYGEDAKGSIGPYPLQVRDLMEAINRPSDEAIVAYNAELDKFYLEHDLWLEANVRYVNQQRRTVTLDFLLSNEEGTLPAEDVDITLNFPLLGIRPFSESEGILLSKAPEPPKPPTKPQGALASLLMPPRPDLFGGLDAMNVVERRLLGLGPSNVSGPMIRQKQDGYVVNFHVESVKHNYEVALPPVYVAFPTFDEARSFGLDYKVVAANLPKPVTGKVHVVINKPLRGS